ncbi:MAG: hypothetical protein FWD17_15455 [Polyangiaceae bacterium]|nr:hypothetical protein [Polyangiaceae bacterium]
MIEVPDIERDYGASSRDPEHRHRAVGLALWILLSFALSEHSDAWAKLVMVSGIWVNALSALIAVVLYAVRRKQS